jgi:hypothetical protein
MEILNQVIELQRQGLSDDEIYQKLRNMGASPKEIQDSINQAKIKSAVYAQENPAPEPQQEVEQPDEYAPQPQNYYPPQQEAPQEEPQQQQDYYTQTPQAYDQNYYSSQPAVSSETISEIAEQIVSEKISEFKKETGDINSFQTRIQEKVSDIDDRLKRIENAIDKLQQAVIGKIGEFGENTTMIQKDIENLHGTVSKLMNPLIDNYNELKKISAR